MEKEKREHDLLDPYSLIICPICGHNELKWGVIKTVQFTDELSIWTGGQLYGIQALRCLKCDSLVQMRASKQVIKQQTRIGCIQTFIVLGIIAAVFISINIWLFLYAPTS